MLLPGRGYKCLRLHSRTLVYDYISGHFAVSLPANTKELPDGNVIRLNSERFKCPEAQARRVLNPTLLCGA